MCGIAGIVSYHSTVDATQLAKMLTILSHRGPDGEGTWINETKSVALGHRRLSIIDTSDSGRQPMSYLNERYQITFNGEIYNYIELKQQLESEGITFQTNTDTEVLLALYHKKRENMLSDLDGMFAFAIWDSEKKQLFCARDRFGEKPFYYFKDQNAFFFASEMKALFGIGIPRKPSDAKIYNYLLYSTVEDPVNRNTTFFENIFQIEPGHSLTIKEDGSFQSKQYWSVKEISEINIGDKEAIDEFNRLFETSVSRRLRSDVPVGSSLSGGLDSSAIVATINRIKKDGLVQKTFSGRFKGYSRDEGDFMNLVIASCNVEPHFVYIEMDEVIRDLKKIVYHQEAPFTTLSIAAQFEVMKLAKANNVTVLLDGQGADEMLAGYSPFWTTYLKSLFRENRSKYKSECLEYAGTHGQEAISKETNFHFDTYFPGLYSRTGDIVRRFRSSDSPFFKGIHPHLVEAFKKVPNPIRKPISLKDHLKIYLEGRGLNELLRYADRNSMAHSVEVRLPFLSHELVSFVLSLPDHLLLRSGWTKYILRRSMEHLLPKEIVWRKEKIGFEPPQQKWMKDKYFVDLLNTSIEHLKKDKLIAKADPAMSWHYISLHLLSEQ